jgi:hypothetical protein
VFGSLGLLISSSPWGHSSVAAKKDGPQFLAGRDSRERARVVNPRPRRFVFSRWLARREDTARARAASSVGQKQWKVQCEKKKPEARAKAGVPFHLPLFTFYFALALT